MTGVLPHLNYQKIVLSPRVGGRAIAYAVNGSVCKHAIGKGSRKSTVSVGIMRILVANAPPAYQEVIASALRSLRPHLDVRTSAPEGLDDAILSEVPDFVICSRMSEVVQTRTPAWLLLYPDGDSLTVHSLHGRQASAADLAFDDLLALVDRAETTPGRR